MFAPFTDLGEILNAFLMNISLSGAKCDFSKYGIPSEEWLHVEATLPPRVGNETLEDRKKARNLEREAAAENDMKLLSGKVTLQDYMIPTRDRTQLEARVYRPSEASDELLPIYMHFHGGGFLFGTLRSEDGICSRIAVNVQANVVNVNYRHTPEFPYPTAWNDAEDSMIWVCRNSSLFNGDHQRLVIGGISAGGWLAASVTQAVFRGDLKISPEPAILGQVLMIPSLVYEKCNGSQLLQIRDPSLSSYQQNAEAPILNSRARELFHGLLKIENPDTNDLRLNPGNLSSFQAQNLPPTTIGVAGYDPLRDDGLLYGKLLAESGVPTNINVFKGVPHGFRRFGDKLSVCKKWDEVIEEGIRWAWTKPSILGGFTIKEH